MKKNIFVVCVFLILCSTFGALPGWLPVKANAAVQDLSAQEKAQQLLALMTPEERIGQLFLVSFQGVSTESNTKIFDLIVNYHIGGVIFLAANNNFIGPENAANEAYQVTQSLQQIEWQAAQVDNSTESGLNSSMYIPLFITVSQNGDGYPDDQLLGGVTPLPSLMSIGATFDLEQAKRIGEILGKEFSSLGFNLLLGPSLDVIDLAFAENINNLGVNTFGASPYWVAQLGQAYIEGVHSGSQQHMAVVAKHFPGKGSADRDPSFEVATVRKTMDQLLQFDLAPFLSVTDGPTSLKTTDGLLLSHIRYEGLQGNIRSNTKPISMDAAAVEQLFTIPAFDSWRKNGGIIVSDNLGSQAIRRFYDPNGVSFDARQIARNAINAGNDLLYLDNFVATGDADQYTTLVRTAEFLVQKYQEDEAFARRVDGAVERLLTIKFRLYPEFNLENVIPLADGLATLKQANAITFEVAQAGITLLNPKIEELSAIIPNPPGFSDRTVFFTDMLLYRQCDECPDVEALASDALQKSVIRLYGPQAGGDIAQYRLSTFSFIDLANMLDGYEEAVVVEEEMKTADWIVFVSLDVNSNRPASHALRRLLDERPELLVNKKSIVFAFNAPYYLDATEISKLTAYYGVYSKIPAFADVAARILFQEIMPLGAAPISIPAVGYDLNERLAPDPSQLIPLMLDKQPLETLEALSPTPTPEATPQATAIPSFQVGDTIPLITGTIYDRNQNPVPDGTQVRFIYSLEGENTFSSQFETQTIAGVARAEYLIQNTGRLEISVVSGEAVNSQKLVLNITQGAAAIITVIAPTVIPSPTITPTLTVPTITPTLTSTPLIIIEVPVKTTGSDWLFSILIIVTISVMVYWLGKTLISLRWGLRWALLAATGGLFAYTYLSINIPGNQGFLKQTGFTGILIAVLTGCAIGFIGGYIWHRQYNRRKQR